MWTFAKALTAHAGENVLPLRVGVATDLVVVLDGNHPVGPGVLKADSLSALSEENSLHVNRRFWEGLIPANKRGWREHVVPDDSDALRVWPPAALGANPVRQRGTWPRGAGEGAPKEEADEVALRLTIDRDFASFSQED